MEKLSYNIVVILYHFAFSHVFLYSSTTINSLPILPSEKPINCGNCVGACCSNVGIQLSGEELATLVDAGTNLVEADLPRDVNGKHRIGLFERMRMRRNGINYYRIVGECALLDENGRCSIYEQPERPQNCSTLQAGSYYCRVIRVSADVDQPEVFRAWHERTQS